MVNKSAAALHTSVPAGAATATAHQECPCTETSGTVVAMRHVPGFRVIENHYPAGLELTRHHHDHAYLSYVLEGPYSESYGNAASVTCAPRVLRFLPVGMAPREHGLTPGRIAWWWKWMREALEASNEHKGGARPAGRDPGDRIHVARAAPVPRIPAGRRTGFGVA